MSGSDDVRQRIDRATSKSEARLRSAIALDGRVTVICVVGFIVVGILYALFGR